MVKLLVLLFIAFASVANAKEIFYNIHISKDYPIFKDAAITTLNFELVMAQNVEAAMNGPWYDILTTILPEYSEQSGLVQMINAIQNVQNYVLSKQHIDGSQEEYVLSDLYGLKNNQSLIEDLKIAPLKNVTRIRVAQGLLQTINTDINNMIQSLEKLVNLRKSEASIPTFDIEPYGIQPVFKYFIEVFINDITAICAYANYQYSFLNHLSDFIQGAYGNKGHALAVAFNKIGGNAGVRADYVTTYLGILSGEYGRYTTARHQPDPVTKFTPRINKILKGLYDLLVKPYNIVLQNESILF